jgi:hypothetical protein
VSILKTLFHSEDLTAQSELDAQQIKAFDAANAALDRAIAVRQAAEAELERRVNEPNRRKGGPDTRPSGSSERRNTPQPSFGRRRTPE